MNQRSPLLNYRIQCFGSDDLEDKHIKYDFETGLWVDEAGEPLIKKYIDSRNFTERAETLITKTREGIDRSEGSNFYENDISNIGKTTITETRESIDRSENSLAQECEEVEMLGETLITRTREGVDRSEGSTHSDNLRFQTLTTYTRESIDRSENS